jgi:hypothetical protein
MAHLAVCREEVLHPPVHGLHLELVEFLLGPQLDIPNFSLGSLLGLSELSFYVS